MIEQASWIWVKSCPYKKDLHAYFRKSIPLRKNARSATVEITAGDHYQLFCNGEKVGEGPSPAAPKAYYYDTYEVELSGQADQLCLFVHVYAVGQAEMVTGQNQALPGLLFAVRINYGEHEETYFSSSSCRALIPPEYFHDYIEYDEARISKWGGFEEVFLSHLAAGDPSQPDYDDTMWENAAELPDADRVYQTLIPREIPTLCHGSARPEEILQIEPYLGEIRNAGHILTADSLFAEIDASRPQSYPSVVLDFGRQTVGHPVFEVCGSRGASMRVLYGESLDMMRMDTLIMSGERQKYRPYQRRAFRYMKLTFNNSMQPVRVYGVYVETERYPFEYRGGFRCSDEMLNRICRTSIFTVQQNAQEHYEDCVMREKMQWLADARVMSLVSYWNFGDYRLSRKAIRQFFCIQQENGLIPAAGPQAMDSPTVDFAEHFVMMLHEYWMFTGDLELIREYADQLRRIMDFFAGLEDADGLINMDRADGAGLFLDWARIDKRERVMIVNCMYYDALRCVADLLEALEEKDAPGYRKKAETVRKQILECFWDEKYQLFCDCAGKFGRSESFSEQSNLCAVFSHVLSGEKAGEIIRRISDERYSDPMEKIRGAFYLSLALPGLFENGAGEKALSRIRSFWGEMLRRGATAWWETFDPDTPQSCIPDLFSANSATSYISYIPCSHCHGWGAGPAYLLPRYVLGIEVLEPGFKKIRIRPFTGDLLWAEGKVCTPHGVISVAWKKQKDGEIRLDVGLPDGVELAE